MRALALAVALLAGCLGSEPAPELPEVAVSPAPSGSTTLPDRPLILGRPPHLGAAVANEYAPLAKALSERLGHPITLSVAKSYDDVVDELTKGEIDLALLTPFSYVTAKQRLPNLQLLASLLGEGAPSYLGYIVVPADKPWRSLQELKGKRFGFVDKQSASGYLYPMAELLRAGINPERDFVKVQYLGSHPAVVEELLAGRIDAGAISSTTFAHLKGQELASKLTVIAKTDWIPFDAFVAHPSVPPATVARLREILLDLNVRTQEGRAVLTGLTVTSGFVATDDAHYASVRRVATELGLLH